MRSGFWTDEEMLYMDFLIQGFKEGSLDGLEHGATLRAFLAKTLRCNVKRISKKMEGFDPPYNGRLVFLNDESFTAKDIEAKKTKLQELNVQFEASLGKLEVMLEERAVAKAAKDALKRAHRKAKTEKARQKIKEQRLLQLQQPLPPVPSSVPAKAPPSRLSSAVAAAAAANGAKKRCAEAGTSESSPAQVFVRMMEAEAASAQTQVHAAAPTSPSSSLHAAAAVQGMTNSATAEAVRTFASFGSLGSGSVADAGSDIFTGRATELARMIPTHDLQRALDLSRLLAGAGGAATGPTTSPLALATTTPRPAAADAGLGGLSYGAYAAMMALPQHSLMVSQTQNLMSRTHGPAVLMFHTASGFQQQQPHVAAPSRTETDHPEDLLRELAIQVLAKQILNGFADSSNNSIHKRRRVDLSV